MTPEIIAHRGASYLAPENTLAAFRKARELGADGVEMDVQQTSDKKLVIHHDYIIDFHTDMAGQIYDMSEGELKELDFGSWKDISYKDERIATLHEALELCKEMEGIQVQLEMKATIDDDPAQSGCAGVRRSGNHGSAQGHVGRPGAAERPGR